MDVRLAVAPSVAVTAPDYTDNERWYLALTALWAARLRAGGEAGPSHAPGSDIAFAERALGLRPGMRVLDLAASWGRTSFPLARRGYEVVAFDLSDDLLAIGRERAAAAASTVGDLEDMGAPRGGGPREFRQGTVRLLPDLGLFDAVCAFYDDSLLSFEDEADNLKALRAVARSLRPGGRLLFGTTDCPPELSPRQVNRWREGELLIEETICFDAATGIGESERRHTGPAGAVASYRRRRRHYRPDEAAALLGVAGLTLTGAWCAYDEALPYGARPEGMVLTAERVEEAAR